VLVWRINQNIVDEKQSRSALFERSVIASQASETFLFSIFPWQGGELSFHCNSCDVLFAYEICSSCHTARFLLEDSTIFA